MPLQEKPHDAAVNAIEFYNFTIMQFLDLPQHAFLVYITDRSNAEISVRGFSRP